MSGHNLPEMKRSLLVLGLIIYAQLSWAQELKLFEADNPFFQYTGRIDFSNPKRPRFWTAGVYIRATFTGSTCDLLINDEELGGTSHNYLEIAIDNLKPFKIETTGKTNTIRIADSLAAGAHTVIICKNTEALIGHMQFVGLRCAGLVKSPDKPVRKIEFIGDSITTGTGSDLSPIKCDSGQWYDQHNAWYSYGPMVARTLNAQWHLTAEAGIGLIHSCCNKKYTMPQLFDKVNLSKDSMKWDFTKYQPDVVTICLGQNDGVQDSVKFCAAYVDFVKTVRKAYGKARIVCLGSPMADDHLRAVLKRYLAGVVVYERRHGDTKVDAYFFSRQFHGGCGGHPDQNDHRLIADELGDFIAGRMGWN